MANQGNLYPPDFSGSNLAAEKKAPRYVKGFESLGMNTYLKKESGLTIQENRFFDKLYSQHTLANNYEYTKYLKGYTEGFFVDVSGGVSQGQGYLGNSVYPVAIYCLPPPHSLDQIPSITTDSIKAIRERMVQTH